MSEFLDHLLQRAAKLGKTIALAEGSDPRVIEAADKLTRAKICKVVLIGSESKAREVCPDLKLEGVKFWDPAAGKNVDKYAAKLYELRKEKGMTEEVALRTIKGNNMFYACTALKCGDVDGVVGGAVFSSADVSRAAFQVIKAAPGIKSVSSCFVMIPPEGFEYSHAPAFIFADCAVIPYPTESQLADIVQAAYFSAKQIVEVEPKIAMLSFSSKGSAQHESVDKVRAAYALVKAAHPYIDVDGELQLDAAIVESVAEKKTYIDSLMLLYDLRVENFGDHQTRGKAYILDRKARDFLTYSPLDHERVLELFREAIAENPDPELVAIYFKQLTDYYREDGEGSPDEILAEYQRLSPVFDGATGQAAEYKDQFDRCFGISGVASCENLEAMFKEKLAASNNDPDVVAQAFDLMSRAQCDSEFYLQTAETFYEVKPSAETALLLAEVFQNKNQFDKAITYLTEALSVETDNAEKVKLLVRIGVVQLAMKNYSEARKAALEAQELNPEDGMSYFVLAQCYGAQASTGSFASQAIYWVAYDTMEKAAQLLDDENLKETANSLMAAYRNAWPSKEECFFNEVQIGTRYVAAGVATTVRCIR